LLTAKYHLFQVQVLRLGLLEQFLLVLFLLKNQQRASLVALLQRLPAQRRRPSQGFLAHRF
jgi:hypothetical protein